MTCAPCKAVLANVAKLLEKLPPQDEPLRGEIRRIKEMVAYCGYHIVDQELRLSKTRRTDDQG